MSEENLAPILVLVRDLLFSSRISATASALHVPIQLVREPARLSPGEAGRKLIVDLNLPGALEAAAAWSQSTGRPVIAFVSHTDAATIARARSAGLSTILPRSRFVEELAQLLQC